MRILLKLDRLAAWVLFVGLFLYFITGLGMTKGIISPVVAYNFHLSYLTYFVLAAFVIHTAFAISLAFKRWRIWNPAVKIILALFYVIFVSFFFYVDKIYQPARASAKIVEVAKQVDFPVNSASAGKTAETVVTQKKVFSAVELAKYNGLNGNPAYAAVDGVVYDFSSLFIRGQHFGYSAGQDLTAAFNSKHDKSLLSRYPVVGILR